MPGKPIQIKGMPYVPGVAHGVLQHELDSENRGQRAIVSNIRVNCSLTPINSFNTVIELQLVANVLLVSHSFFL